MREGMIAFADRHLGPYIIRGDELIPDFCPICHGGNNRDRYTFALNLTQGVYVCKRGSCGARGRLEELTRRFGEQTEIIRPPGKAKKQYVLPDVALKPLTDEIIDYFAKRKISRETLEVFRIGSDDKGNIVFPFYRDNALVYVKYRAPRKPLPKEKATSETASCWRCSTTTPINSGR